MSKQSVAKQKQGYVEKPFPRKCSTCYHYEYEEVKNTAWSGYEYVERKKIRCGVGKFAVKGNSVCNEYKMTNHTAK